MLVSLTAAGRDAVTPPPSAWPPRVRRVRDHLTPAEQEQAAALCAGSPTSLEDEL